VSDTSRADGDPDRGFDELFALPEPDGTRYLLFVTGHGGGVHHVGTFDAAALGDPGEGDADAAGGLAPVPEPAPTAGGGASAPRSARPPGDGGSPLDDGPGRRDR
jgi:hypothetical protein